MRKSVNAIGKHYAQYKTDENWKATGKMKKEATQKKLDEKKIL